MQKNRRFFRLQLERQQRLYSKRSSRTGLDNGRRSDSVDAEDRGKGARSKLWGKTRQGVGVQHSGTGERDPAGSSHPVYLFQ